ncbi:hypothetical protein J6590_038108 [Homalodisca vitripennis]|nr:hypothetical protein J6590_038108 [Homalodisca vitripennis]
MTGACLGDTALTHDCRNCSALAVSTPPLQLLQYTVPCTPFSALTCHGRGNFQIHRIWECRWQNGLRTLHFGSELEIAQWPTRSDRIRLKRESASPEKKTGFSCELQEPCSVGRNRSLRLKLQDFKDNLALDDFIRFTFHLVQHLRSNSVTDFNPEICNQHLSEEIQNSRRRRSSKRTFDIRDTWTTTDVIKMKW